MGYVITLVLLAASCQACMVVLNRALKETPVRVIIFYYSMLGIAVVGSYILIDVAINGMG